MRGTRSMPWLTRAALPAGGALLTGALGVATYMAHKLNEPRPRTWRDEFSFSPFEVDVPYEDVSFRTEDDLTIRGWFFPRPQTCRVVVCCTGHRAAKYDLLGIGAGLWRAGYNVLLFDFRGCGDSDPAPISLAHREVLDTQAAIRFVRERVCNAEVALLGYSMGAAVSILVAANDASVRAVVADSSFTGIREVVAHILGSRRLPSAVVPLTDIVNRWRYGYSFAAVRPVDEVGKISPSPILIIHGKADLITPVGHAYELYANAGQPKELWIVPHAPHCGAYFSDRAGYVRRVAGFLDDALSRPPAASLSHLPQSTVGPRANAGD